MLPNYLIDKMIQNIIQKYSPKEKTNIFKTADASIIMLQPVVVYSIIGLTLKFDPVGLVVVR